MKNKLYFPEHGSPTFSKDLASLKEYQMYATQDTSTINNQTEFDNKVDDACNNFEKANYQHFVQHYLSKRSPYRSILLYHGLGVGKTCSAITVAESFLLNHTTNEPPKIIVVSPSSLKKSFEEQVFSITKYLKKEDLSSQCTSDTYAKLIHGNPNDKIFEKRMHKLINSRYQFLSYDGLITYEKANPNVTDKIIIIDEVHNLRQTDIAKSAAESLERILKNGKRNRLVLLSATPMYNEPDEIFWLLGLLLKNDGRKDELPKTVFKNALSTEISESNLELLKQLSSEYISYIRGKNPFTFAARIHPNNCDIETLKDEWAKPIIDGLVPTIAGSKQAIGIVAKKEGNELSMPKQIQWLNITYPKKLTSSDGFWNIFSQNPKEKEIFPVTYKPSYEDALMPTTDKLGAIAAKLLTICNQIKNSEGIVMVYSRYVWNGVIPLAVALEHMGFRRYGGKSILSNPNIQDPVSYPGNPFPQYCILSGDPTVTSTATKDNNKIRADINDITNINGKNIKVVLITPIAGEGLSFQNIRSVHIMDPWYHMNLIEQVIGRAIRTCSHRNLPLEERNVSVFLHTCITSDGKTTADIHAYKIAARKLEQTRIIEKIIRDNAVDCSLMYYLNYYPRSNFKFNTLMRTSQGTVVSYKFGDDDIYKPECIPITKENKNNSKKDTLRKEVYMPLIPTVIRRMEKYIRKHISTRLYYTKEELLNISNVSEDVLDSALEQVIYPNQWFENYRFYSHKDSYVFIPIKTSLSMKEIVLPYVKDVIETVSECDIQRLLSIPVSNEDIALLLIYNAIDSKCWNSFASQILDRDELHTHPIVKIMTKYGLFVKLSELPRWRSTKSELIGYVDIFQKDNFQVSLKDLNGIRDATEQEVKTIKSGRNEWKLTNDKQTYGILEPVKFSKDENAVYRYQLKLMIPEANAGAKRGVVCTSKKKTELIDILDKDLQQKNIKTTENKDQICFTIGLSLLKQSKLKTYPLWKPKN